MKNTMKKVMALVVALAIMAGLVAAVPGNTVYAKSPEGVKITNLVDAEKKEMAYAKAYTADEFLYKVGTADTIALDVTSNQVVAKVEVNKDGVLFLSGWVGNHENNFCFAKDEKASTLIPCYVKDSRQIWERKTGFFSAYCSGENVTAYVPVNEGEVIYVYYRPNTYTIFSHAMKVSLGFGASDEIMNVKVSHDKDEVTVSSSASDDIDGDVSFYYIESRYGIETVRNNNLSSLTCAENGKIKLKKDGYITAVLVCGNFKEADSVVAARTFNTKNVKNGSSAKSTTAENTGLVEPMIAVAKTNIVAGYATPSAKVSVKIGSKTYSAKADETGLYKIVTSKLAKKNYKIWETVNGKDSKAITFTATSK